jgi:hypothetical protein
MDTYLMAKLPKLPPDASSDDIPEDYLAEAREAAIRKKAQLIAERELGLLDDGGDKKVVKGPLKKLPKEYTLTLELAPHSDRIILDGVTYLHGATYTFDRAQYDTIREIIYRGYEHQAEIEGKPRFNNSYQRAANLSINPGHENVPAQSIINTSQNLR